MEERKDLIQWVKMHKKELIIAGVSISAIIAVIIGVKNHKALEDARTSLGKLVEKTPELFPTVKTTLVSEVAPVKDVLEINILSADRIPHNVAEHLRNLPAGWKASAEKMATAVEHGYDLLPGQTWVEAYRTGGMVA